MSPANLIAARWQMGLSLAFHIVFAVIGMAMPVMMVVAESLWLRTGRQVYLDLTKRWARGTAIFFAVGAVSGTVLSFELGLLWPRFMELAGGVIGMPFSLEGFAFFLEAIFLGVYLYGWNRASRAAHLFAGVMVAVSGACSGMFVVTANAWMNTPAGFRLVGGRVVDVNPLAAMMNPAAGAQVLHMLLAAYTAVGLAVAGVHARMLLRRPTRALDSPDPLESFHRAALGVALLVGLVPAVAQPFAGDFAGRVVARTQPAKLAAMEDHFETAAAAPLKITGPIAIPSGLSLLAYGDANATVVGLNDIPRENWPPVVAVRAAFQIMVAIGVFAAALGLWAGWLVSRRTWHRSRPFLRTLAISAPLGFVALEAGWGVTELGRQPWIIQSVMRTSDAVTPMPGIGVSLAVITIVYIGLAAIVTVLIRRHVLQTEG
jgi:cytochrome d ubiquinol oxidase subunit I